MAGCILRPKCSNGNESRLYQSLYKFTGKDRKLTNKYYKMANHPRLLEGVDDSLIERDSNNELTLESFLKIAELENVDVKLLEYLNNEYPDSMHFDEAINIVKEFNRNKFYKDSFIATMYFDGGLDKVRVTFKPHTPMNRAESQRDIERMITINDVISQLIEHGVKHSFIEGIISGNPELLDDTISGFRALVALAQGVPIKSFTESDFENAANFAISALEGSPIMTRFLNSISSTSYGDTNPVSILAKTFKDFKWGKLNNFMSKVREFIYNTFKVFNFNHTRYLAESEQIVRGLYSALSALPQYKSYDVYTIGYENAQRSLGAVLTSVRKAASDIHNASTKLYEGFLAQFNRKNLLSEIQINTLNDEICYTEICDITAGLSESFTETLNTAAELSNDFENLPYKADLIRSCRDMYTALVTICQEYERAVSELAKSTDPEAAHFKATMATSMADLKRVISQNSSFVSKLQQEERNITLAFFEEVLGKDCVTVSAHRYFGLHKKFLPKLKYRHSVTLTAADIVDKYVSYESASMWVKSLSNSKDIAVAELEKYMRSIKFKEEKVKDNYFVRLNALTKRAKELGLSTKNMTWAMEVDSNGKITGNFVVEEWWGEFNREKKELLSRIREEFNEKIASGVITISEDRDMGQIWNDFYNSHPDYILFMNEAFLDKDKPLNKRRVLNLGKYTNPQFWELSEDARNVLSDFIKLKSEIDTHCLKDADGTEHGRRVWLPQFKRRSKVQVTVNSYMSGNDVSAFAETAELGDYGSPEFTSINSESLDIFGFENDAVNKILLYGINKTEETLNDLETNIPLAMAKYILMAIRYKTVKSTASFLHIAKDILNQRSTVTSEDERIEDRSPYANEDYSKRAIDDLIEKYSGNPKQSFPYKFLSRLNLASSYLLLSFNIKSALRNRHAGTLQTIRNTIAGKTPFTMSDYLKSTWQQFWQKPGLLFNTLANTSQHFSRTLALLEYVGSLKLSDVRLRQFNTPKVTLARVTSFLANACMAPMSTGDHAVMAKLYRASLMSHKGFDIKTGERRSIWDEMQFQDGRYLYQGMLVKKYKDIRLATTLNSLKSALSSIIEENSYIEDDEDKIDYSAVPSIHSKLQALRDMGYPIDILVDGIILTDEEVLDKVNEMLNPLIVTEDDIFNILFEADKLLIHDQGNYNSQDKVKVMTEEYVNGTTHFQGWLYGTIQAVLLNNVNVGTPSVVKVKKSDDHLREDYLEHLKTFGISESDLSFSKFKRKYAERYMDYEMPQYNTDVSYSRGYFQTWLGAIISFFAVDDAIRKVYNQNLMGVKGSKGEFKITPEEVLIEANKEFTEAEKQEYINSIKEFTHPRYYGYMLLNMLMPFVNKSGPTRRFLMRCGWSPDELASMGFLGIAMYVGILLKKLALLFYKGNLKNYGKSKPKGAMEATRATQKSIPLIKEGYLFDLMTDTINGPGSEKVEEAKQKLYNNPISMYGQEKEQIINPDGYPSGEYVYIDPESDLFKEILEGIEYKSTEYDKEDWGYILSGFLYHHVQNVNREMVVKYNPYKTMQEANKLFDMKSSTIRPILDVAKILTCIGEEMTEGETEDVNTSNKLKKYFLDKYIFGKVGMETDKYGNIDHHYEDYFGTKVSGFYIDEDGNKIYNYDHMGLHFIDFYSLDNKVQNFQNQNK